jgi:SAM-dependent methyltransferase
MTLQNIREVVTPLSTSILASACLAAAIDARISGVPLDPRIRSEVDEVVGALGARELIGALAPAELAPVLAELRLSLLLATNVTSGAKRTVGWGFTDPELLQCAGVASSQFPHILKNMIVPTLPGLGDRLASADAAFLDVGVGVGMLAIEMTRVFPSVRVVGLDVWGPSLALARENVRRAGAGDRIELREQAGEDVPDESAFDLAWIPSLFIPPSVIPAILSRVHRALRPGGWVLFVGSNPGPEPLMAAVRRSQTAVFGGAHIVPGDTEATMRAAGFADVRTMPAPPTALATMIVGRRA